MLRARRASDLATLIEHDLPILFPDAARGDLAVHRDAFLAFTSIAMGWTENTTEALSTQPFHELGMFQTPGGPRSGPAPHPTAGAYTTLGRSADVKQCLGGREANLAPGAWKTAHADQVAIGLANLRQDEHSLQRAMGADLVVTGQGFTPWRFWCMFTAFSRGPGQTANVLRAYRAELLATPVHTRLQRLRALVARDLRENRPGIGSRTGKMGAAYAVTRTEQKLEGAALLADDHGHGAWWTTRYTTSAEDATMELLLAERGHGSLARQAADVVTGAARNVAAMASEDPASATKLAAGAGVLALGGVALYKARG